MKTAVSIPDPLFRRAERLRKQLKLSRSQLYAQAVERLLADSSAPDIRTMSDEQITAELNKSHKGRKGGLDPVLASLQSEALQEDW